MALTRSEIARNIVKDIIASMRQRNGLLESLEECDDEIREEIEQEWVGIVESHIPYRNACDSR